MPQSPPEQRLFALDLVDLMVTWEETRKAKLEDLKKDKKPEDGDGMDVDTPTPTSTTSTTPGQAAMVRFVPSFALGYVISILDGARFTRCRSPKLSR